MAQDCQGRTTINNIIELGHVGKNQKLYINQTQNSKP
jgi:hypothetical protein